MKRPPFLLLLFFTALAGCGDSGKPAAPLEPLYSLTEGLDVAEIDHEPGIVDLGTPEARSLLRKGWSRDEGAYVWSDGPESELDFFLAVPRDVPLTLRGEPYRFPGALPQEVSLILNGESFEKVTVDGKDQRVVLPERHLRAGTNRLVLRYAWTHSPQADPRRLAVAWDLLRFETGVDAAARVRAAGGQLALPFGWRVTSYLRVPKGAALTLEDLRLRDDRAGDLRVTLQSEQGEEREIARLDPGHAETVELEDEGLVRLSLAAVPEEPGGPAGSGLVLKRPAIAAPRAAKAAPPAVPLPALERRPRNVVLYLVDTLRADHLGCYGYGKPVSPRTDAFAREATLFRRAVAQSPWTRPSMATILTGLLPRTHGVNLKRHALPPEAVTLAEALKQQGYATAGFVTNGNVARSFGFAQGFDTYELLPRKRSAATDVSARAAAWLEKRTDAPFFLYLHTVQPHAPYNPPEPFRRRFAPQIRDEALTRMRFLRRLQQGKIPATPEVRRDLLALYDAEIATNDAAFGELIDLLVREGLWEDTMIVFVSDHGEEFLDHGGWEHGKTLHTEMLDVPLIIRIPGIGNGKVLERQAQHADLTPTILSAVGVPVPAAVEGRSLLPWMNGAPEDGAEEVAFSWLEEYGLQTASATTPEWRLIEKRAPVSGRSLYDRRSDPGEKRDLGSERPVRTGHLATRLRAEELRKRGALRAGEGKMDAELRQQLRALGYVH
ncbi:MAG TPA: sulfatase [Thermoanaerobaculia bacterium]